MKYFAKVFGKFKGLHVPPQFIEDKFIFIHVPKTAGSSFLNNYLGYQIGHTPISKYFYHENKLLRSSFSCSFVRDPIKRFVSAYNHINTCTLWPYLTEAASKISKIASSLDELALQMGRDNNILDLEWFRPQHSFLSVKNKLIVTRVFKTEEFNDSMSWISTNQKISFISTSSINQRSSSKLAFGSQYLSEESQANLRKIYWRDYTLFGYY